MKYIFSIKTILILLSFIAGISTASAQGLDKAKYRELSSKLTSDTNDEVEVIEFFWYGCGHCFALEPRLAAWLPTLPKNARFVKVPAMFSSRWEFHAKAFYTMEVLGVLKEASNAFFKQIHIQRKGINDLSALNQFLSEYELTPEQVAQAFNSFTVDTKLRYARKVSRESVELGAPAEVPGFVIGGKYFTNGSMSGSVDELFEVADGLIEKAAQEQKSSLPSS